ncbi:cation channel, TrkA domain-containing [Geotalea daltonii FRC-32]|uniref:Cation channel, TrkA domain-containing n=1 Tax=Geotalea daltonii (strain DSM 22248 / JCM 15807 / FRC-32) TaxID=316067 RepID=B9LZW6_GEODF|nr:potassium channel protein [Geotalea daltonii]ACM18930.1 cation channel, TrkA domain-containing [Geotalea daltonii FRC-32]
MDPVRHLKISVLVLALLVSIGTAGYSTIEGWRLLDALYMTVITLGTVGFREIHELSDAGKIFTMVLIFFGVSVLGYIVGSLAQIMFEGQLQRIIGRKKVEKKIDALSGHYIICGFGRIGALICKEFAAKPLPFVVVENDPLVVDKLAQDSYLFLRGNATDDETLLKAGIKKAKGLISVVTSDTENVYITLTARGLNPDLYILARSGEEGSEIKLKRAGANKVVSPYLIGGSRMAQAILRPNVMDFIEIATGREHLELQIEEIVIPATSGFIGENLASSGFRRETGVIIVGIKKASGKMVFNPESHTHMEAHDTLIVLGQPTAIFKLEELVNCGKCADDIKRHRKNHE